MAKFAALFLVAFLATASAAPSSKISSGLQARLRTNNNVDILINFQGGSNNAPVLATLKDLSFPTSASRGMAVKETLQAWANQYQTEVLEFLEARSSQVEQFVQLYVSNQVYVRGASVELIAAIAEFSKVTEIKEDERIPLIDYTFEGEAKSPKEEGILAEWGVENTRAHLVWAASGGNTGEGVIVSTIDTGVRYTHQALASNYLGTANGGWLDPYTNSANPIDQNGHGTHTTGTIAGSQGVGVAPGARWSACRGCDTSSCSQSSLTRCAQWTACPGTGCANIPKVSSNSWGGGRGQTWFDPSINAMNAAGVIVVFANGNSGSACNTANSPADNPNVIGVGSITSANALSSFSSKGASAFGTVKPDISAPGSSVRSAYHTSDTAYSSLSGTSMACPHVSGVVALLASRNPSITYSQVYNLLTRNANTSVTPTGQNCGGISDSVFPNNSYGYGRVDALAAFQALIASY